MLGKIRACYKESKLTDAPYNVQQWARAMLRENGIKNADSVPLKVGEGWKVVGGRYIQMDRDGVDYLESNLAKNSLAVVKKERSLLHESKHYHNGDFGKGILFFSAAITPCMQAAFKNCFKRSLLLGMMGMMGDVCYGRYQEAEADRFAFMNLSSVHKLEAIKNDLLGSADRFEDNLLHHPFFDLREFNALEEKARPVISGQLRRLNQKSLECSENKKKLIDMKKKSLIGIANFIFDYEHPSYRRRIAIAQECLDKRQQQDIS